MPSPSKPEPGRPASPSSDGVIPSTPADSVPAPASSPVADRMPLPAESASTAMPLPDRHGSSLSRRDSTGSDRSLTNDSYPSVTATSRGQLGLRRSPPPSRRLAGTYASSPRTPPAGTRRTPATARQPSSTSISRLPRPSTGASTARWPSRAGQSAFHNDRSIHTSRTSPLVSASEKPLPPRPVATLASAASPSKDGRTLIDASEQPLQFFTDGHAHDWPALSPRFVGAPYQLATNANAIPSSIPRMISVSNSRRGANPDSTIARDGGFGRASALTNTSSHLSFVSAQESVTSDTQGETASIPASTPQKYGQGDTARSGFYPPRDQSLAASQSFINLQSSTDKPLPQLPPLPDFAKDMLTSEYEAHKRNTPPANFSRPMERPHKYSAESSSTGAVPQQQNTMSRIPTLDNKKSRSTRISTQGLDVASDPPAENSPSLSGQSFTSPNAPISIDRGGVQRRLQRTGTKGSTASDDSPSLRRLNRSYRIRDHSGSSTPAYTAGASSADEDEPATPVSSPLLPRSSSMAKLTPDDQDSDDYDPMTPSPPNVPRTRRGPPSTSRHTGQLPTIPSQSVLSPSIPVESLPRSKRHPDFRVPSSYLSPARRPYRQLFPDGKTAEVGDGNHTELIEKPNVPSDVEDAASSEGELKFNRKPEDHHTRTLSQLEGHRPHLRESTDFNALFNTSATPSRPLSAFTRTNTLIANAAAAEMFLERGSVSSEQIEERRQKVLDEETPATWMSRPRDQGFPAQDMPSKWSDSTPSGTASSSEGSREHSHISIGYPSASRIPSIVAATPTAAIATAAKQSPTPDPTSRNSSPTLSPRAQYQPPSTGSVKRAREEIVERSGSARTTAAAESKKAAKATPSTSKALGKQAASAGGRDRTPRTGDSHLGARTRSKSKSRAVLAKVTGLFKKDKKSDPAPLPALLPPPTLLEAQQPEPHAASPAVGTSVTPLDGDSDNVTTLANKLESKAREQSSPTSRARMLNFTHILRDAVANAKQAAVSAEEAKQAASAAQTSYEKTQLAADMLQRLATSLVQSSVRR
ncbi:hypothetical protein CERZMDRAFT_98207 [Cercospora zeae-maydis SCOH1-5]|uniref:Uncharacterized protein n=1 Tax=Cercospora zeae-maydis SCOH1-5 TaxID=717836 RepID=A0A6A6FEF4_9PEZI|nr:hypothetical protein CERZMDRAFT_98207 [Cercospora zeae-maydis SCOH1-5]